MKIKSNKFINIRKIVEYLGIKVLKKCLNGKEKLRLVNTIGVSCKDITVITVNDVIHHSERC